MSNPTIVAIATSTLANAGVGIVRLSGPASLKLASKVLSCGSTSNMADARQNLGGGLRPRMAEFVTLHLDNLTDPAIAIYFPAPKSFTGEDIVEIHAHGGTLLLNKIVETLIAHGARMATPGEFTRRAVLNGKMNLIEAEHLANIIHAESDAQLATNTTELDTRTREIEAGLIEISAQIEGALDHPDDIPLDTRHIEKQIHAFTATLEKFIANEQTSNYIFNGISVAIFGEPNVGKSTLFNALLGVDRAIVTPIAGTTTDSISETFTLNGYKIRLIDTAGIRATPRDEIEAQGIARTLDIARTCDIAIVFGKLPDALPCGSTSNMADARQSVRAIPTISVTRSTKIADIKHQIIAKTVGNLSAIEARYVANARQLNELKLANVALTAPHTSPDELASNVATALFHIGNITGTNTTESVLDAIFSRFCLGK